MNIVDLLDRPIAFQRAFVRLNIGITGALMLSQAIYWTKRTNDAAGWFWKTSVEWEEETGLTRREQDGARSRLRELGIMEESKYGIPPKLRYRIDTQRLDLLLETICTKAPNCMHQNANTMHQNANLYAPKRQIKRTETTTEITTEITPPPLSPPAEKRAAKKPTPANLAASLAELPLPEGLGRESWAAFVAHRVDIKKPLTAHAADLAIGILQKLRTEGNDPRAVIEQSILSGYSGLFALKGDKQKNFAQDGYLKSRNSPPTKREETINELYRGYRTADDGSIIRKQPGEPAFSAGLFVSRVD